MTAWSKDELRRVGAADELQIAGQRSDGTLRPAVTIWVVRVGDDLYVRSVKGQAGKWFLGMQVRMAGHISAGGVEKDVAFGAVDDPAVHAQIDIVYHSKYDRYGARYVDPIVNSTAQAATLKLTPR